MSRARPAALALVLALAGPAALASCAEGRVDPYRPRPDKGGVGFSERLDPDGGYSLTVQSPWAGGKDLPRQLFDRRADELCDHAVATTNTFRANRVTAYDGNHNVTYGDYVLEGYVYCRQPPAPPAPAAAGTAPG